MSGHLTLDELRAFIQGTSTQEDEPILEHCRTCPKCGDSLAAMLALTAGDASRKSTNAARNMLLAAATLVILVGALVTFLPTFVVNEPSVEQQLAALATTEPPPAFIVRFQVGLAAPAADAGYVGALQEGAMMIPEGRYEEAATLLRQTYTEFPNALEVGVYLGVAQYLQGDTTGDTGALLALSEFVTDEAISRLGRWYLANHLLKTGEVAAAETVLEELAPYPQRYGRRAATLLEKLKPAR